MNKSALKTFATSTRKELLKKVEVKAMKFGITEDNIKKADIVSSDAIFIDGKQLSNEEKIQRDKLIVRINQIGFKQVIEEVAYTWFNRFTALRYMEVNEYLPTDVRVLSSTNTDRAEPDMMNEALTLELEIDKEYVYDLKLNNKTDELFKYLIIKHCNDLNRYLPFMFETIDDYTEILFPEGLMAKDSFINQMTNTEVIPEDNWKKVEVIGWLYQYYIAEEKERVFKAKKKYKKEEIPFATQLFTPDWIVRYMVENSLGRYWVEAHPEHRNLLDNWEFYLENPNTKADFEGYLTPYINKELKVEDIKCFDPAMGSGHILVYMFDVLYEIYSKCGYMEREIPRLIIENNLYGLDIDDRAYQLACFSVVMKGLEYNGRFFRSIEREGLKLNLASIQETNTLSHEDIAYIAGEDSGEKFTKLKEFIGQFTNAKTYGSLIKVVEPDKQLLSNRLKFLQENPAKDLFEEESRKKSLNLFPKLIKQIEIMVNKYDVLVTNPPYMGTKYMNKELSDFLKKNYPDSKADTFASFMELSNYLKPNSIIGTINQHSWMFLSSYEKLRKKIIRNMDIISMIHLGSRAFEDIGGEVVQTTSFIMRNSKQHNYQGIYIRLVDFKNAFAKKDKYLYAKNNSNVSYKYTTSMDSFEMISGNPIAYWTSEKIKKIFANSPSLSDLAEPRQGLATGNTDKFIRMWYEIEFHKMGLDFQNTSEAHNSGLKWFPINKGGHFRKWYGNQDNVIAFDKENYHLLSQSGNKLPSKQFYFKEGITWTKITSSDFSVRYSSTGSIFSDAGMKLFIEKQLIGYMCSFLNSKLVNTFLGAISETMNFEKGNIEKLPIILTKDDSIRKRIDELYSSSIFISKGDWDSFETSWNFIKNPLLVHKGNNSLIQEAFNNWSEFTEGQFKKLKENQIEINEIFIKIYDLEDEISPNVEDKGIAIRRSNMEREIKSLLSYFIGCIFGRYSLDEEGIVYAGGDFDEEKYQTFKVDRDNILPILPGVYFEDDIVTKFVKFVELTFGKSILAENLEFIARSLGKKKEETPKETIRRYFLNDFFKDHIQEYKSKPIYWLFSSGKQKAFNCLIYMHRYDKTTLSRIRTDYLHEYQIRLDAEKNDLLSIIDGDYSTKEISTAKKELKTLDKKVEELKNYDELLHHMADMQIEIDLDDGIAINYNKFKGLVAII